MSAKKNIRDIRVARLMAEQGDPEAQVELATCFEEGYGVKRSRRNAAKWYRKAASQGHVLAQFVLGEWYQLGCAPFKKNEKLAVRWYKKAAEQGDPDAQYGLYSCYVDSEGSCHDTKKALKWLEIAADNGQVDAQRGLACNYHLGELVEKDMRKAAQWYRKAAKHNDTTSQCQLGILYYFGEGVKRDYPKSIKWFDQAAEKGDLVACQFLGHCYYNGIGVEKDRHRALTWFLVAHNHPIQNDYHPAYWEPEGESLEEIKKQAEQGDREAQCKIGFRCYNSHKYKEAYKWLRKAAEQNHFSAQQYLGYCYYSGLGVEKNEDEAAKWFDKAVIQILQL